MCTKCVLCTISLSLSLSHIYIYNILRRTAPTRHRAWGPSGFGVQRYLFIVSVKSLTSPRNARGFKRAQARRERPPFLGCDFWIHICFSILCLISYTPKGTQYRAERPPFLLFYFRTILCFSVLCLIFYTTKGINYMAERPPFFVFGASFFLSCTLPDFLHPRRYKIQGGTLAIFL